jgi:catechol-2,3-dioxygenase
VVLNVGSLERSVPFYRDVIGLHVVARRGPMAFFSFGASHHDIALRETSADRPHDRDGIGMFHFALRVGTTLGELRDWKAKLEAQGVPILRSRDHRVSQSLYIEDPDGIVIELYVDADPAIWRDEPDAVATTRPLRL